MFDLHSVTLTNFRAYRGTHEFEFPVDCGLYFFTGKNNSALGANAAGKSTLLDAIVWVLYGRTTRGLKANEIITWGCPKGCAVTLVLTVGAKRLQIQRTQKPNGLFLSDKPVDQKELEKSIRLNYEAFMYSVINSQFGTSFLSISPAEKLTLFSDIMNLDFWLKKSDEASNLAKKHEGTIESLQTLIDRNEGQLTTVAADIKTLQVDEATFEDERADKIAEIKQQSLSTYKEVGKLNTAIDKLKAEKPSLVAELKKLNVEASKLEGKRDDCLLEMSKISINRTIIINRVKELKEDVTALKSLGVKCPTCYQAIHKGTLEVDIWNLEVGIKEDESKIKGVEKLLQDLTEDMIRAKNSLSGKTALADEIREEISELDTELTLKMANVKNVDSKFDELGLRLHEAEGAKNPHSTMLAAKRASLKELKAVIAESGEAKGQAEAQYETASFWIKGFKRIRLFIIEQAFRTLEIEVNNCLAQLGMPEWQISFDVERENKSGGVTKGFVVFVKSPANNEPVRWENWSGGETQRLQLAGDLGLANLIMQQAGLTNTIEFYDEPSTHLSPEGMMDLANMLHDRAISEQKRIWIVDHGSITNFGDFRGIITARKDGNGSSITYNTTK